MHPIRLYPKELDIREALRGGSDLAGLTSAAGEHEPHRVAASGGQPRGIHDLFETLLQTEVPGVQHDLAGQPSNRTARGPTRPTDQR